MIKIEEKVIENKYSVNNNKRQKPNESSNELMDNSIEVNVMKKSSYSAPSKSQQLINSRFCSQTITPNNSCSRIVLNCNTNFSSLRIEDPKRGINCLIYN
jgi:hypothetical protein